MSNRPPIENTDLIDVSDVEPVFDDEEFEKTDPKTDIESIKRHVQPSESSGPAIAPLKDRCAAFAIDLMFLYIIYWPMMLAFRSVAVGEAAGPIPAAGIDGIIFHGIFMLVALIWFVIPEMAFGATLGKAFCHLTVRRMDAQPPGFLPTLVRNILRPLDVLLGLFFILIPVMEWSHWQRRIGDIAAGTFVLKRLGAPPRQYALSLDMLASASARAIAFFVDIALFAAFAFGLSLLLSPEKPLPSMILLVLSPVLFVAFFVLPEWLAKTSPGKWALGFVLCQEDGSSLDMPSALVRTLWKAHDMNPCGLFTCLFSVRKQRAGDVAAQSVVIKAPREWKGLGATLAVLFIAGSVLYAGMQNTDSYLHEGFEVNFLPSAEINSAALKSMTERPAYLALKNFTFAAGDANTPRKPSIYEPGENLYMVFEVDGFKRDGDHVWIQEDLNIRYPDDTVGLKLENINDFNQQLTQAGPIKFENNIAIPENAQAGRYTVTLTVRDKLSRQELKEQRFFYVTPPESKPAQPGPSQQAPGTPEPPPPAAVTTPTGTPGPAATTQPPAVPQTGSNVDDTTPQKAPGAKTPGTTPEGASDIDQNY